MADDEAAVEACIVAGCPEGVVIHRQMRVSVPVYKVPYRSDGGGVMSARQEQTINAALCATHDAMLKDVNPLSAHLSTVAVSETTGRID